MAARLHQQASPPCHSPGPLDLVLVMPAIYESVDRRLKLFFQGVTGPRSGHQYACPPGLLQRPRVPRREVHAPRLIQDIPIQLIVGQGLKSLTDGHDRPLPSLQQGDRSASGLRTPGYMHPHASFLQLPGGRLAISIATQGTEEVDVRPQLGQHHRGHPAPTGGPGESVPRLQNLALDGEPGDLDEVDPLHMTHHGDVHCARVFHRYGSAGSRAARKSQRGVRHMGTLSGSSTADIDAPLDEVWALVEDVERAPEWQGGLKDLTALERDNEGRATLCESETDGKVRTIRSTVRFSYDPPTTLSWRQEKGELKSVQGSWILEALGEDRTRVTYELEVDLGRMLGLVIRGPMVDLLRGMLVNARAGELKRQMES